MVFLSRILLYSKPLKKKNFIDKLRIYARGGGGGQGLPKYGGEGGRGGHVHVTGEAKATLSNLVKKFPNKRFVAASGANSKMRAIFGEPGEDLYIPVPTGIVVTSDNGRVLGEINEPEDTVLIAKGGAGGGRRNNYLGRKSTAVSVTLDLKLLADIGLVGFPNAGKSTLLSALSRAAPKIASYPFTTIQPQLGTLEYEDARQITMADLPGLIEGAHVNVGMGHSFLKHVERTSLLLFVVDINGFRLNSGHELRSALENILLLNKELELYREELVNKPAVLAVNKVDIDGSDHLVEELLHILGDQNKCLKSVSASTRPEKLIKFDEIIPISAKYKHNTDFLKDRLRKWLDFYAEVEFDKDSVALVKRDGAVKAHLEEHRAATLV